MNPVKIAAARGGFRRLFPDQRWEVRGVAVPSGVSHQPMDDAETLTGAEQRATNARTAAPDAEFWVGIEGGVEERGGVLHGYAWVVVLSCDREGRSRTASFEVPPKIADLVRNGVELGDADDRVFGRQNSKQGNGAVGLLTGDAIDRVALYQPAVTLALIPFRNTKLYPQGDPQRPPFHDPVPFGSDLHPARPGLPSRSMLKEKLIAAKQRWAEKQKAAGFTPRPVASADRLPPGQRLTSGFPVLDLGVQPAVPLDEWSLSLDGEVENPSAFSWEQFSALPQVEDISDFHCVTTWSKYDCRWGGVAFTTLCDLVQPRTGARFVYFTSYDGYSTNVPLEMCLDDDVLVATRFDGSPLPREHGGPARVIIPKLYAWKGAKFIKGIHFLREDRLGFWEVRGYSNSADPWKEERYA